MVAVLPVVDRELCDRCGLCVEGCPCHAIEMTRDGPVFHCSEECVNSSACAAGCSMLCEEVCPVGAISCGFEIVMGDGDA